MPHQKMIEYTDSPESQDILLDHVLFSRVLPQEKPRQIYEQMLMIKMVENVENHSKWMPTKTVEMLQRLKKVHLECTPSVISEEINIMEPGDTFAMYVRRQNCAIMIHMPANELVSNEEIRNVIVATFPGNLHPREIYKHDSDLEVRFFFFIDIHTGHNNISLFDHLFLLRSLTIQSMRPK